MKTTKETGNEGEARVAEYLRTNGYIIKGRNWKNRYCEIDIVAEKHGTVFFVEVKFRANAAWGDGFDAIGARKLERMSRAAEAWVQQNRWKGGYELLAASVDGTTVEIREI